MATAFGGNSLDGISQRAFNNPHDDDERVGHVEQKKNSTLLKFIFEAFSLKF